MPDSLFCELISGVRERERRGVLSGQKVAFGFGAHSVIGEAPELLRMAQQADRDGLDIFSLSDHPYLGERLDAYASIGFVLGCTQRLGGFANVTNLPTRPAPMLARAVTSLSAGVSAGRAGVTTRLMLDGCSTGPATGHRRPIVPRWRGPYTTWYWPWSTGGRRPGSAL
jgi:hypothetical protein